MTLVVLSALSIGVLLLLAFAAMIRHILGVPPIAEEDHGTWLDTFSVTRYRPMERLLSKEDFEFLASQPGYDPGMSRKLRAERRRIFRSYLRQLRIDFIRLHQVARLLVLYSPEDRPD